MQGTGNRRANALGHELVVATAATARVSAEAVYDVLADLDSHLTWAGERQGARTRLLSMEAPSGPAVVGTEFRTTGIDPMGTFEDRSVVTEATRPTTLEFVTEARLRTRKGVEVDWTNVHRYELTATAEGCRIRSTIRIARISELPGGLAMFRVPVLRAIALKASARIARRGVRNLARVAEEREGR